MKRIFCALCCVLLLLLALALPGALRRLPSEGRRDAPREYAGVIRLWVWQGMRFGEGWLKVCCARYEKAHSGQYVQIRWVSEAEMRLAVTGEAGSPDAMLFPSGMVDSPAGLDALAAAEILPSLPQSPYALPVAMSGYVWCQGQSDGAVVCPEDSGQCAYSAALIAACARYEERPDAPLAGEGMSLGLPTPESTRSAPRQQSYRPGALARRNDACALLAAGNCGAILIARPGYSALAALSGEGRAAAYTLSSPGAPFTDLIAWFSVPGGTNAARVAAAQALGAYLLAEECQAGLKQCGAFRVTPGPSLYDAASGMAGLEAALSSPALIAAPPFSSAWREAAPGLLDEFFRGRIDAWQAADALREAMKR